MGIKFFKLSFIDKVRTGATLSVTDAVATNDGSNSLLRLQNRSDKDGFATTGSADSANTTIVADFGDLRSFNRILLANHNFKAYTLKYWHIFNEEWTDFSAPISETDFQLGSSYHEFELVESSRVQLVILGTKVADDDKFLRQFLIVEELGELTTQVMTDPIFDENVSVKKFISGKNFVTKNLGGLTLNLQMSSITRAADLELLESLHRVYGGFHVYLSGGAEVDNPAFREGYRLQDIYFMMISSNYNPRWRNGRYKEGIPININMVEVA